MNKYTLQDIAGYETEKQEAKKLITILQNYDEYVKDDIFLPKGLLLVGEAGVGKTLLATAIINESNVNLVTLNSKDENIIENIKLAFNEARKSKPSILFFDEIDSFIGARIEFSDLQRRAIQTLLTEIDGLNNSNGILLIATANDKSCLPRSLLRSGRLEKQMTLTLPTFEARENIFDLYLSKHDIFNDISRESLSKKTNGFTGADINNLINEVLIDCKINKKKPTIGDFEKYIPTIIFKDVKRENDKEQLKYIISHEIGHFITTYILKNEIPSITVDRYDTVTGYVKRENKNMNFIKLSSLEDDLTIVLGGIAGEKAIMNDMTTISDGDVKKAEEMIKNAISVGMFGFDCYYPINEKRGPNIVVSDSKISKIENKISEYMNRTLEKGVKIIKENIDIYNKLKDELIKEGSLSSEKISKLLKVER